MFVTSPTLSLTHRTKHDADLKKLICSDLPLNGPNSWSANLYDSFIATQKLSLNKQKKKLNVKALRNYAQNYARSLSYGAFSFGICDRDYYWISAFQADESLVELKDKVIEVNLGWSKNRCRSVSIDYIANDASRHINLYQEQVRQKKRILKINSDFLEAGTLAYTCFPRNKTLGPISLALLPLHLKDSWPIPGSDMITQDNSSLMKWVNKLRKSYSLPKLKMSPAIVDEFSRPLLNSISVKHDRQLLGKLREQLSLHDIKFLGENRVIGSNAFEMAWLLWQSPRHRSLLLHDKADYLSVKFNQTSTQKLGVLVFAKRVVSGKTTNSY